MHLTYFKQFIANAVVFFLLVTSAFAPASAHEYWLNPILFEIPAGETIMADLRNGENYKGGLQIYVDRFIKRFEVHDGKKSNKVTGANGDQPAAKYQTQNPGLHIITYQSTFDSLVFNEWEKFLTYLENQGLDTIARRHLARGLPKTGFKEEYARTVKSLVKVGHGEGQDLNTGMPFEFVAQDNPYTMGADPQKEQFLKVRLFLGEKWQANKQVLIFQQNSPDNNNVTRSVTRTDARGYVQVPLKGGGKFMLSSVHMFEGDDDSNTKRPEWLSYWANLTFALPGADELLKKTDDQ